MTKERGHSLRNLLLILTALPCSRALEVSIPNREYEVAKGNNVTMTCTFIPANPDVSFVLLTWEILPGNNEPVIPVATYFSYDGHVDIGPKYEGRAILSADIAKRESTLTITNVNRLDSHIFQCSLTIPNDDEGTTAATTSLLVLEAPSKPLCNLQGTAVYGNNISLTCRSENGFPTPTYAWQSYDVQNIPRQFPPTTREKDGVLSLFNVSMVTSGFYICASTNRIGSASCNFTLAVTPSSMNLGATAGIVVGVLAGLIVLAVIVFCCCRKKKQKYNQGSPETVEFHDKPSVEDGKQHWDDKSNNQTMSRIEPSEQFEQKDVPHQSDYNYKVGTDKHKYEDDQHSYYSNKESNDGRAYDMDTRQDRYGGSRDGLDDSRGRSSGSRDRLDDSRGRSSGSRDRLDDSRGRSSGSRDRLDDHRDRYGGSRDRLDDSRGCDSGSRDRLDDSRGRVRGSRDRLDDRHDRYGGSREHLDYIDGQYDERRDRYGGSDDRLSDKKRYG